MFMPVVPVLMYHHVNPHKGDMISVRPDIFDAQMRFLVDNCFNPITISELLTFMAGSSKLPPRSVLVTFDDGWLDNYLYAFHILKKYGIKATIFPVTNWVDNSSKFGGPIPLAVPRHAEAKRAAEDGREGIFAITWEMANEMKTSGLIEFYSHTVSHRKSPTLTESELVDELTLSRKYLEDKLDVPCHFICWPYGKFNEQTVVAAREAGYQACFTTKPGVVSPGCDRFTIPRIVTKDSVSWFKIKIRIYTSPMLSRLYLGYKELLSR